MAKKEKRPNHSNHTTKPVEQVMTGIAGFDQLAAGGLSKCRTTLFTGTAGSGKTVFAAQFLAEGVRRYGEPCVFVTLEESPDEIRRSMLSLGWDIAKWEAEGTWTFVDGTAAIELEDVLIGDYDLGGLLARIHAAVARIGAKRLAMDAVGALLTRFGQHKRIRSELFRISHALRSMQVTSVVSSEMASDYGEVSRYGVEEFVVDNVIILRNRLESQLRRRTVEILKMRGVAHRRGEHPFIIIDGEGIEVAPVPALRLEHGLSNERTTFGNADLNRMCNGGPFRDAVTLVSGVTGAGKTLLATEFACGATNVGERCLFVSFEEGHLQMHRNAAGWGLDFGKMEADGLLRMLCEYPEAANLEDRLVQIKKMAEAFSPHRIVLDSITALERMASPKSVRDFVLGLTTYTKQRQIPLLMTALEDIVNAARVASDRVSSLIDCVLLLRYVEVDGRMRHGITVLKMRGSAHDNAIREFTIDGQGMHIGVPFKGIRGALLGQAVSADSEAGSHDPKDNT